MIPSTRGSNPRGSGDEPDEATNTILQVKIRIMTLKIKRLTEDAIMPIRAHEGDAGIDLTCTTITQELNEVGQLILVYHTGLAIEIPEGYVGLLFQRSSVSTKSIALTNAVGVIDSGYRGEVMGKFRTTTDVVPAIYKPGERFAQLVIVPILEYTIEEAAELSESAREDGGFGSTGNENIPLESINDPNIPSEGQDEAPMPEDSQKFPE